MMDPLDPIAFEAFKRRCELMGKDLPDTTADARELEMAYWRWQRSFTKDPLSPAAAVHGARMAWSDHGGRSVHWFTYPQDIGALRVSRDLFIEGPRGMVHPVQLAEELVKNDDAHNRNARMEFQALIADAERQATHHGDVLTPGD